MKFIFAVATVLLLFSLAEKGSVPDGYQGKPFEDERHNAGPQVIPGRLEAALDDLGGEGVAYHDANRAVFLASSASGGLQVASRRVPEFSAEGLPGVDRVACLE
jgi:hypothetical protein